MSLPPNYEDCTEGMDDEKPCKVEVSTVDNSFHYFVSMQLGRGDALGPWYPYNDVNLGVDAVEGFGAT